MNIVLHPKTERRAAPRFSISTEQGPTLLTRDSEVAKACLEAGLVVTERGHETDTVR